MRLLERDEPVAVIHAALDAGVRLLDTARAYSRNHDLGDGERVVAEALKRWSGPGHAVRLCTKVGMRRPKGKWVVDGRAKLVRQQAADSAEALGRAPDLLLLHAVDPRAALGTSVRALLAAKRAGAAQAIGLCNVTRHQLEEALAIAPIAAVQVALHPFDDTAIAGGLVERCAELGIELLAHSPLGGPNKRRAIHRHEGLTSVGARLEASAADVALAWLADLSPCITPLAGATRIDTARRLGKRFVLSDDDRERLDAISPSTRRLRTPASARRPPATANGEVVLLMGIQGAGKSRQAHELEREGYLRLNRDEQGGTLSGQLDALDEALTTGPRRVVLDNTYPSRAARGRVIDRAWAAGVPVRCCWIDTPLAQAQINVVRRLTARYGALPGPERLAELRKSDPQAFDPRAQFRFERALEAPTADEGFRWIERVAFEADEPERDGRALFLQCEQVLRRSLAGHRAPRSPDDVALRPGAKELLAGARAAGKLVVAFSWLPDVAERIVDSARVDATFARTAELLGIHDLRFVHCPHGGGAPRCWCRPPLPGLVVPIADAHGIDLATSTLIGHSAADRTLAERLGMTFVGAQEALGAGATTPPSGINRGS